MPAEVLYIECIVQVPPGLSGKVNYRVIDVVLPGYNNLGIFKVYDFNLVFNPKKLVVEPSWVRGAVVKKRPTGKAYLKVQFLVNLTGGNKVVRIPTIPNRTRVVVSRSKKFLSKDKASKLMASDPFAT